MQELHRVLDMTTISLSMSEWDMNIPEHVYILDNRQDSHVSSNT